jgi:hypothetical protein
VDEDREGVGGVEGRTGEGGPVKVHQLLLCIQLTASVEMRVCMYGSITARR